MKLAMALPVDMSSFSSHPSWYYFDHVVLPDRSLKHFCFQIKGFSPTIT
jgi:hypothetical protein